MRASALATSEDGRASGSALGDQVFQMLKGILRLEYQYIAFQGVQHDFCGVADQCAGQSGPRHGAQYGYHGLDLAGYMGDQYVCRAFGDVQLAIAERVLLLEALAAFAVAAFDGVLELEGRIG